MLNAAFMKPLILAISRHLATTAGGALASYGVITSGQVETVSGALLTLVGVALSAWDKVERAKK
ncbi:MAG: hypothetical protein RLZ51_1852 [Pseudomonadota bacterium]|jgi:hypothetical protein